MKPPSPFSPVLPGWSLAFCLGVAAAVALPSLGGGFIADDFVYIARFAAFPWSDWPRLFTREWSEGIWGFPLSELRPFSALSFMLDARLYGGEAAGYRLTNLLLHLGVVAAVVRLTWRMSEGHTLATLTAGLAFALHPAHVEPVAWITGRVDLLSTLGAMAFWVLAELWSASGRPWRAVVALTCLGIGVFAKELSLFAPPLLLLRWLVVDPRGGRTIWQRRLLLLLGVVVIALVYTLCRRAAFGDGAAQPGSNWHQAAAWQRQVSYLAWLAPVLPFLDQFEWKAMPPLAVMRGLGLGVAVLTIVGLAVTAWKGERRWGNLLFFTAVWWLVTVGGLLLVGYFSARHLYFPTTGLAVGLGLGVAALGPRFGRVLAGITVLWFGVGHLVELRPWVENGRLSRALIERVRQDFVHLPKESVLLVDVPEIRNGIWVWFWAAPQAFGPPFLSRPIAPERVLSRGGVYFRPEQWEKDVHPLAVLRSAPGALALGVSESGNPRAVKISAEEISSALPALAALTEDGRLEGPEFSAWMQQLMEGK